MKFKNLQFRGESESESHSVVSNSLPPQGLHGIPVPRDYMGIFQARTLEWVGISLLQGIFPTQGLDPGLPHCRRFLYHLSHKGNPGGKGEHEKIKGTVKK